jgi:hypothetical protein
MPTKLVPPATPSYLDLIKSYAKNGPKDPIDMGIRNGQVMRFTDSEGRTWAVDGGPSILSMKVYRDLGRAGRTDERPVRFSDEDVYKAYIQWLKGEDESNLTIPGCTMVRGAAPVPRPAQLDQFRKTQAKGVDLAKAYDPSNPMGCVAGAVAEPPGKKMTWGDRPDYVPHPAQQAKRDEMINVVYPMLQQKAFSLDTISTSTGYNRDYVRQISKEMCTPEEHKENLKRKDA